MALHICSNCVPSTDHAEAASRLAMQAASLDTDTLDPLALGRVDTRQLQLVSGSCRLMRTSTFPGWGKNTGHKALGVAASMQQMPPTET